MPLMTPSTGVGQVNVRDEDVDRYKAAGWTEVKSSTTKKSTTSKSSSAKK